MLLCVCWCCPVSLDKIRCDCSQQRLTCGFAIRWYLKRQVLPTLQNGVLLISPFAPIIVVSSKFYAGQHGQCYSSSFVAQIQEPINKLNTRCSCVLRGARYVRVLLTSSHDAVHTPAPKKLMSPAFMRLFLSLGWSFRPCWLRNHRSPCIWRFGDVGSCHEVAAQWPSSTGLTTAAVHRWLPHFYPALRDARAKGRNCFASAISLLLFPSVSVL